MNLITHVLALVIATSIGNASSSVATVPAIAGAAYTASAAPAANSCKFRIPGGERRQFTVPMGARTIMFRGLNLVAQSVLQIYTPAGVMPLAGNGTWSCLARPGDTLVLSNDGNYLEFSVEVIWQ